jgi:hypothetical protein
MLTILILVVGSVTVLVVLLLVIVVIGIRQEPSTEELSEQAPSLIAAFVRRLLGTCVRKPYTSPNLDQCDERPCLAAHNLAAGSMHKPNPNER